MAQYFAIHPQNPQPRLLAKAAEIDAVRAQLALARGYDHNYVLDGSGGGRLALAARVREPVSGRILEVETTEPGIQFYSGNYLDGVPARDGRSYHAYQGLALETQFLPDSPHHPEWPQPSCWLEAGQVYDHTICYRFR